MSESELEFLVFSKISTKSSGKSRSNSANFIAQEKIHGAHFVIGINKKNLRFGKRKEWLAFADPFFGWQLIREDLGRQSKLMYDELGIDGRNLYLYGELFGGHYPHTQVRPVAGMTPVQTGVWYCPDVKWSIFDAVACESGRPDEAFFIEQNVLLAAVEAVGGISPPLLGRGSPSELTKLPVRFQSRVASLFGLPEIANNFAEGLVIKPASKVLVAERDIQKIKIPEFDEKQFDESQPWDKNQHVPLSELLSWAERMVNAARLDSARSKLGEVSRNLLVEEIILDILIDLSEAFPAAYERLTDHEQESLSVHLKNLSETLVEDGQGIACNRRET
jgi:Rnl2 family RNA ligase